MTRFLKNYIGGRWVTSAATEFEEVVNPATEEALVNVPLSSEAETAEAIRVADEAFQTWKKVSVPVRGRYLFKLHHLLMTNKEELARLITLENGKSLSESLGEVQRGIENVEHAAGITNLIMGDSLSTAATDIEITNYRYPIGVVGGITPFNFPMMVPFWIFPMALAAGNTVVLKPSEKTPLLMEKIVELIEEAGFPSGVFNVVYGAHDVVNTLLRDPLVKGISFVGSKNVGEYVYKEGTKNLKRVQALTGAKNHVIVLKDANLDRAVKDIIGGSFGSAGERCMAASVIVVEETIADKFKENTLNNNFGEYYYLCKCMQRKTLKFFPKVESYIYFLTCGYGERPEFAVYSSLVIIIFFAFVYLIVGIEIDNKEIIYNINTISKLNFFKFINDFNESLTLSVGAFGGLGTINCKPVTSSYIFLDIEILIGIVMMGLGIGTLTRKVVR